MLSNMNIMYLTSFPFTLLFIRPTCIMLISRGKKSLVLEPGTNKISIRTSIYFHPMSYWTSQKTTVPGYMSLNGQHYWATGQVKI